MNIMKKIIKRKKFLIKMNYFRALFYLLLLVIVFVERF